MQVWGPPRPETLEGTRRRARFIVAAALSALLLHPAPAAAYDVRIEGVEEPGLRALLSRTSRLESLRATPPVSRAALGRRAEEDVERLTEALRSEGFYAAILGARIEDGDPALVRLTIDPGPIYLLADYAVTYVGAHPAGGLAADMEALDLHAGMPARAAPVDQAQRRLLRLLAEGGRPLAGIVDRRIVVDHGDATMTVALSVDPGPPALFSTVTVHGLAEVERGHVLRFVSWRPGEPYDIRKVDRLRERLTATNLFDSVTVEPAAAPDAGGGLPLAVTVVERPRRSVGFGAGYATDEGLNLSASWEHRNLFGEGERLAAAGSLGEAVQSLSLEGRKPHVLRLDQDLLAEASVRLQDAEAFDESTVAGFVGVERKIGPHWSVRGGPSLEITRQDDGQGERRFNLAGLPLSARRDTTDDLLDPTAGTRLAVSLAPYVGVFGRDAGFVVGEVSGSAYWALGAEGRHVLAGRFRIASIAGDGTADLPASKRLYAGGGGSVRGYALREVGPLDAARNPLGGRSAVEAGIELRLRVFGDFGIVPFIEGGNVYDGATPDPFTGALWAAGIGFRYFTPVGPLRLDVAFPINGRAGIDDAFQFYISLGQAF